MATVFTCACGKRLLVNEQSAAAQGVCPGCGQIIDLAPACSTEPSAAACAAENAARVADSAWEELQPQPSRPAGDSGGPKRYQPLYSPRAVSAAALLGGWPAGCFLLAGNYWKLQRKWVARLAAFIGFAGAALIFTLVLSHVHVPARWGAFQVLAPLFALQLVAPAVLLYAASRALQGGAFAAHMQQGGKAGSIVGLTPLCIFVTGMTFFLQAFLTYPATWDGTGGSLTFGPEEKLFYTEGVSVEEARRLGAKLEEYRIFDGQGIKTVIVLNSDTGFTIRIFKELAEPDPLSALILWQDAERVGDNDSDYYQVLCRRISREVFAGEPVEILLHDLSGVPQRSARGMAE